MSSLSKAENRTYWANRKAGKRGQGPYPDVIGTVFPPETWKEVKQIMKRMEEEHK